MAAELEIDPVEDDIVEIDIGESEASEIEVNIDVSKPEPKVNAVDASLVKLREQLKAERRARAEAERKANEYAQTAHNSRFEAQNANLHLISSAIDKRKQDAEILKANYSAAMASQDYETSANIQMQMASVAAELQQLTQGKQALESAPKVEAPKLYTPNPVEAFAAQLSPRSSDWVRAHPEFVTDPRKQQKMLAAHQLALADGLVADTDEYFSAIEDILRIAPRDETTIREPLSEAAQVTQRRAAPPAAPVSRSGAAPGANPRRVTLSSAEREMADIMDMTPQEYARHKLALQKQGKIN